MDVTTRENIVRLIVSRLALNEAQRKNHNAQRPAFDLRRDEAECAAAEAALGAAQGAYSNVARGAQVVNLLDVLDVAHEQAMMLDRGQGFVADGLGQYGCDAVWAAAMDVAHDLRAKGV